MSIDAASGIYTEGRGSINTEMRFVATRVEGEFSTLLYSRAHSLSIW